MSALNDLPLAFNVPLSGTHLIEASAGSGKTWTLTAILARLLLELGLLPGEIVAVTFTRAATAELKSRVLAVLDAVSVALENDQTEQQSADPIVGFLLASAAHAGVAPSLLRQRLYSARLSLDDANIHTIHSFAQRVLSQTPLSSGAPLEAELLNDVQPLLQHIAADFWRLEVSAAAQLQAAFTECSLQAQDAELQALLKGELKTPNSLAKYLSNALRDVAGADAHVLNSALVGPLGTAQQAFVDVATSTQALRTAKTGLLDCFDLAALTKLLTSALEKKMLSGVSYKLPAVLQWLAETNAWLQDAGPECGKLDRFRTSFINGKLNKAHLPGCISHAFFDAVDDFVLLQLSLDATWRRAQAWLRRLALEYAQRELPLRLTAQGARSNDLSVQQLAALARHATDASSAQSAAWLNGLRSTYKACLLDEFQDTDLAQWTLFGHVFDTGVWPGVLMMVGDPKQAIYRFRGADLQAYLTARYTVASGNIHRLTENFRSTPALVGALNSVFEGAPDFGSAEITYQTVSATRTAEVDVTGAIAVYQFDGTGLNKEPLVAASAMVAARAIAQRLAAGTRASDIAVLVGNHSEAAAMQAALRVCFVASARTARESVFASFEAAELLHLLHALDAGSALADVRRVMPSRLLGYSLAEVGALAGLAADGQDLTASAKVLASFAAWRQIATLRGPSAALLAALHQRGAAQRLVQLPLGERALTNLRHLIELLPLELHSAADAARWLAEQCAAASNSGTEEAQLRLESDHNTVAIMTIHAAKGLEFDVTVLPFMWVGKAPKDTLDVAAVIDARRVLVFDNQDEALQQQAKDESQAETRRLGYVALTRARDSCVLVWPSGELTKPQQASRDASAMHNILNDRTWPALASKNNAIVIYPVVADANNFVAINNVAIELKALEANTATRNVPVAWTQSSYTALQRGITGVPHSGAATEAAANDSRDLDLAARQTQSADAATSSAAPSAALDMRVAFPRGSAAGVALHSLLELADFVDETTWPEPAASALRTVNYTAAPPAQAQPAMLDWLRHTVNMPLLHADGAALTLRHISRAKQLREWPFVLAAPYGATQVEAALRLAGLNSDDHPNNLRIPQGYLNGVIDCIVRHAGRTYLIDYKSNWLGATLADYSAARVAAAVRASGYELQAAIYSAALHMALQNTVPSYNAAQHFGGVIYVFLRGAERNSKCDVVAASEQTEPAHGVTYNRSGVWFHRPSSAALDALVNLFTGEQHA